jgi:hypothetical protein
MSEHTKALKAALVHSTFSLTVVGDGTTAELVANGGVSKTAIAGIPVSFVGFSPELRTWKPTGKSVEVFRSAITAMEDEAELSIAFYDNYNGCEVITLRSTQIKPKHGRKSKHAELVAVTNEFVLDFTPHKPNRITEELS